VETEIPMRFLPAALVQGMLLSLLAGATGSAQETPVSTPSPGAVSISGVSPERFNPTHGTAFFRVSGAFFPADPRDVAVIIDDRQLPAGRLAVSRRVVAASYVMSPGRNSMTLRAWDAAGQVLTAQTQVWAGDLTLEVEIADGLGNLMDGVEVTASLSAAPSVRSTVSVTGGRVEFVNLPDAEILLEARHPTGLHASAIVRASERRTGLVLR
jgi:hypothetical protein